MSEGTALRTRAARHRQVPAAVIHLTTLTLAFVAWWLVAFAVRDSPASRMIVSPAEVFDALSMIITSGIIWENLYKTVFRVAAGFAIAEILGIIVGIVLGLRPTLATIFEPIITVLLTIPSLAFAIYALLAFGLSETALIAAIAATTFPYVVVTIVGGVKDIDTSLDGMAAAFGLSRRARWRHVVIPQLSPYILSSTRYALGIAWKIAVVVELMGASVGVGYQLRFSFSILSMSRMLAWTVVVVVVMLAVEFLLIRPVERRVFAWRPTEVS